MATNFSSPSVLAGALPVLPVRRRLRRIPRGDKDADKENAPASVNGRAAANAGGVAGAAPEPAAPTSQQPTRPAERRPDEPAAQREPLCELGVRRPAPAAEATPSPKRRRLAGVEEDVTPEGGVSSIAGSAPAPVLQYPLIGRETECKVLDDFLHRALTPPIAKTGRAGGGAAPGGSLYVSGGPGTGKTCSVRAAAATWQRQSAATEILEVNCMELAQRSPTGLLQRISKLAQARLGLCASRSAPLPPSGPALASAVAKQLAELGPRVVIIADEVDQLVAKRVTRAQANNSSLEPLFALTRCPEANTAVAFVAIANAVDLLDRTQAPADAKSCASLLFEPYTADQLRNVVRSRLDAAGTAGAAAAKALGPVAVELRVRQVAKASGDCRQVVCLCEQALMQAAADAEAAAEAAAEKERLEAEQRRLASMSDDAATASGTPAAAAPCTPPKPSRPAVRDARTDPLSSVGQLPLEQQVLLVALAGGEGEAVRFPEVCARYKDLCKQLHQPTNLASKEQVSSALSALEQRGLLLLRASSKRQSVGGGGRGRAGVFRGAAGGGADSVVELAVSRKAVRETVSRVSPLLEKCLQ